MCEPLDDGFYIGNLPSTLTTHSVAVHWCAQQPDRPEDGASDRCHRRGGRPRDQAQAHRQRSSSLGGDAPCSHALSDEPPSRHPSRGSSRGTCGGGACWKQPGRHVYGGAGAGVGASESSHPPGGRMMCLMLLDERVMLTARVDHLLQTPHKQRPSTTFPRPHPHYYKGNIGIH